MHGTLPSSMLSVLLLPVIKDKTGKISSIDNYRPIALASVLAKVLEIILLEQLQCYIGVTDEQFGFKRKHRTDMCIYSLKEAVSTEGRTPLCFCASWKRQKHLTALTMANYLRS